MPMIDGTMQDFPLTLDKILNHAAKWHPHTEVVTAQGDGSTRRIGYAALRERAARVSAALHELGVRKGDRVATLAWNTQAHVETWYGIMAMGAVCHTLNPRLTADQLGWMLVQSEAAVMIVSADLAELGRELAAKAPPLRQLVVIDGPAEAFADWEHPVSVSLLERLIENSHGEVPWGNFSETAPCGLCFTSGTTGAPKGVTYTHRGNFLHTLRQLQADVAGLTSRDVVMPVVPMFHANAWGLPFSAPAAGAKLVLPGRQTGGANLARLVASQGVTIAVAVPTVWLDLFDHLDASGETLPTLQRIMVGGAPMPPALMTRIEQRGIEVQTTWGMTELSPLGTATPPGLPGRHAAKSGRPALGVDLLLADRDGVALPEQRKSEGHLWVRGSSVVERYFGNDDVATRDGWFETGDLASIDEDGHVTITGRSKDLIKSGGEWINPAEIESHVASLPQVAMAAVIGRADAKWGERPILIVELRHGAKVSDEQLFEVLRGKVANWWLPDQVIRLPALPLAPTGKIDKLRLRSEYSSA